MSTGPLSILRADALASALDLELSTVGVCQACLSFVSFALDEDDGGAKARREARRMAPDLWDEGLKEPVLASLRRAHAAGVRDADVALRDIGWDGPRSSIVRSIVLRLAIEQAARSRAAIEARARAGPASPRELMIVRLESVGFTRFEGSDS
jgi:hypothetical protein